MGLTDNFIRQHEEILEVVTEISNNLNPDTVETKTDLVMNLLTKLAGKLSAHLAMEDRILYPKLLENENSMVRITANRYVDEMGDISEDFNDYIKTWTDHERLVTDSSKFITATQRLFEALGKRIDKENNELYPMFEESQ